MTLLSTTRAASNVTVTLDDRAMIRMTATELSQRLRDLLTGGTEVLVVDLSRLRGLSSDVVSALLSVRREAAASGARVVLRAPDARTTAMVSRSDLTGLFETTGADPVSPSRHP